MKPNGYGDSHRERIEHYQVNMHFVCTYIHKHMQLHVYSYERKGCEMKSLISLGRICPISSLGYHIGARVIETRSTHIPCRWSCSLTPHNRSKTGEDELEMRWLMRTRWMVEYILCLSNQG